MAAIFKRGRDKGKKRTAWYINYTEENGDRRSVKGFTDRGLTEQSAARIENEVMLRKRGLIDPAAEKIAGHRQTPIKAHLDAFERNLGKNTSKHTNLTMSRVRKIINDCGFITIADIDVEAVEKFLTGICAENKRGPRTYSHYAQAIDSFCNWLVPKKLIANPLAGLERLNAAVDVRRKRRALSAQEVNSLVDSARQSGVKIQGFDGEQRARIYTLAYMTGLRRSEIGSLTPRSFDLAGSHPTVTVEAKHSKHRQLDELPIHPELAPLLQVWLAGMAPDARLFSRLERKKTSRMVKLDLERVGIPYLTADGYADFHAAGRHTHITNLVKSGVSLPEAQKLARHTDINMTMRYTHIGMEDTA